MKVLRTRYHVEDRTLSLEVPLLELPLFSRPSQAPGWLHYPSSVSDIWLVTNMCELLRGRGDGSLWSSTPDYIRT
jgi:hypothetical protein